MSDQHASAKSFYVSIYNERQHQSNNKPARTPPRSNNASSSVRRSIIRTYRSLVCSGVIDQGQAIRASHGVHSILGIVNIEHPMASTASSVSSTSTQPTSQTNNERPPFRPARTVFSREEAVPVQSNASQPKPPGRSPQAPIAQPSTPHPTSSTKKKEAHLQQQLEEIQASLRKIDKSAITHTHRFYLVICCPH